MHYVCQNCKQARATVHVTDTQPEKRERHLCEDCAEKEGIIVKQQQTTNAILQEFIKHKTGLSKAADRVCEDCGISFREFQSSGQLGCPNDYNAFRDLLSALVQRAHEGHSQHVGKVPPGVDDVVKRQTGLMKLRRELREAIEQENYELAARVRDAIRAAESPNDAGSS